MRLFRTGWQVVLATLIAAPGFALAQAPDPSVQIIQYDRPDREQVLVQGAKKEGEVLVYTSLISEDLATLSAAFER
jgi:iron(III) transport system substrate-binding protein